MDYYASQTSERRWLMKAIREAGGEITGQFTGLTEPAMRFRPADGEWSLKEIAAHLGDAEKMYRRQIEVIARAREPRLPYEPVDVLPYERDYRSQDIHRLLYEWEAAREETVWLLRTLDEDDWERCGEHPYRGRINIYDIVREVHEHDLQHLLQARRLRAEVEELRL